MVMGHTEWEEGVWRRGNHNGNVVMEHRDGIGERDKAMGKWY